MTAQEFFNTYQNKSLLYNTNVPSLRGQCVQATAFYVAANNKPVIWADASLWYTSGQHADAYERIANTAASVPQTGDVIVWGSHLPNSGGAGHVAVCLQPLPGSGTFISIDQNWGGKYVHRVTHNYDYVIGWLRFRNAPPAPQAAPQTTTQGGLEMIANADQAIKIYKMLRPNGAPTQPEIDGTAGRRSFAEFLNSAQSEIAARDASLRSQVDQLGQLSATINQLNQTVANVTADDQADKQKLADALAKVAELTSQLETQHDKIVETQKAAQVPMTVPEQPGAFSKFLSILFKKKY